MYLQAELNLVYSRNSKKARLLECRPQGGGQRGRQGKEMRLERKPGAAFAGLGSNR